MIGVRKMHLGQIRGVIDMAINVLKKSKTEIEKAAEDAKVREVVEATLSKIEKNGDVAVRELSKKFDNYAPDKFLSLIHISEPTRP